MAHVAAAVKPSTKFTIQVQFSPLQPLVPQVLALGFWHTATIGTIHQRARVFDEPKGQWINNSEDCVTDLVLVSHNYDHMRVSFT